MTMLTCDPCVIVSNKKVLLVARGEIKMAKNVRRPLCTVA